MTCINSNNGLGVWSQLRCVIAVLGIFATLTGCAASKPKTEPLAPVYRPAETITLHFNRPLIIKMPVKDPATVEEHIQCGIFYFDQARFGDAASEFEKAREKIINLQNPLYRECLMSSSISHLLSDNKPAFIEKVRELKATYTRYELMVIANRDERVKAIFDLYDQFMKTGNY